MTSQGRVVRCRFTLRKQNMLVVDSSLFCPKNPQFDDASGLYTPALINAVDKTPVARRQSPVALHPFVDHPSINLCPNLITIFPLQNISPNSKAGRNAPSRSETMLTTSTSGTSDLASLIKDATFLTFRKATITRNIRTRRCSRI